MNYYNEYDHADMVDKLAQHRTDNAEMSDLLRMYYDVAYAALDEYSDEELAELIQQEIL